MKKEKFMQIISFTLILVCSITMVAFASQQPLVPEEIRTMGIKVDSISTQNLIYNSEDGTEALKRAVTKFVGDGGEEFTYDSCNNLILYKNPAVNCGINDLSVGERPTEEETRHILEKFATDIADFVYVGCVETGYGYEVVYDKNRGNYNEESLILRLGKTGEILSMNALRSYATDEDSKRIDEVETALSCILDNRSDSVVSSDIRLIREKANLCASCTVIFEDMTGAFYGEVFMIPLK